jgi:hypothetical protein
MSRRSLSRRWYSFSALLSARLISYVPDFVSNETHHPSYSLSTSAAFFTYAFGTPHDLASKLMCESGVEGLPVMIPATGGSVTGTSSNTRISLKPISTCSSNFLMMWMRPKPRATFKG